MQGEIPMNPKKPAAFPPSAIYFLKGDLESLEARCDLGDFRKTDACLYPHKDTAEREDCVAYIPEALAEQREREARASERKLADRIHKDNWFLSIEKDSLLRFLAKHNLTARYQEWSEADAKAARERAGEERGG
jgi:hypothetical protein